MKSNETIKLSKIQSSRTIVTKKLSQKTTFKMQLCHAGEIVTSQPISDFWFRDVVSVVRMSVSGKVESRTKSPVHVRGH